VSNSITEQEAVRFAIRQIGAGLLSDEDVHKLARVARICAYRKGGQLIGVGEVPSSVCLLVSGVTRAYYNDFSGKEATDCIAFKPGEVLIPSAGLRTPSPVYVEALTDIRVLQIEIGCIIEMMETSLGLNRLYNRLLLGSWDYHWEIKHVISQMKARERYLWFLREFPGMDNVVPARHIASFLGMTPVTLSRLRAGLRDGGKSAGK